MSKTIEMYLCEECSEVHGREEDADNCCPCKHENWEWVDVGSDLSYAEIECCDCGENTMLYFSVDIDWR